MKQGNSQMVAVHPDTLEVLEVMPLPEPATVPRIITMFDILLGVGVHQKDSKKATTILPFGPLKSGEMSLAPPRARTDPENSMIYLADMAYPASGRLSIP